jgi:hypothetical protein
MPLMLAGCYYGPGLSAHEGQTIKNSARTLSPGPVVLERANALGGQLGEDLAASSSIGLPDQYPSDSGETLEERRLRTEQRRKGVSSRQNKLDEEIDAVKEEW